MTWYAKNTGAYYRGSIEADSNALESLSILRSYGWTDAAACGLFGNIDYEGQWNPWRWQSDVLLTQSQSYTATGTYASNHGYGLIGWTPAKKYQFNNAQTDGGITYFPNYDQENYPGYGPNWSDVIGTPDDGAAQIKLIAEAMARGSGNIWVQRKSCSTSRFITLTDPKQAAYYWLWNAEYPANISSQEPLRMNAAQEWYNHLGFIGGTVPMAVLLKKAIDKRRGY